MELKYVLVKSIELDRYEISFLTLLSLKRENKSVYPAVF